MNRKNALLPETKFVGFCRFHSVGVTKQQMDAKKCLNKKNTGQHCRHFIKLEYHPYWKQKERAKSKREIARSRRKGGGINAL